jgi:hypothetical protein
VDDPGARLPCRRRPDKVLHRPKGAWKASSDPNFATGFERHVSCNVKPGRHSSLRQDQVGNEKFRAEVGRQRSRVCPSVSPQRTFTTSTPCACGAVSRDVTNADTGIRPSNAPLRRRSLGQGRVARRSVGEDCPGGGRAFDFGAVEHDDGCCAYPEDERGEGEVAHHHGEGRNSRGEIRADAGDESDQGDG